MTQKAALVAALALVAVICGGARAQVPAPAPSISSDRCMDAIISNLSSCLEYVDPKDNRTPALKGECCQGLGDFIRLSPQCICFLLNTNSTDGLDLGIDRRKALNLPRVCKKKLPIAELSKCPGNDKCFAATLEQLSPCLEYVDPASNKTKLASNGTCCSGLKRFVREDFNCLCSVLNANTGDLPIQVDRVKVLSLPGTCNVPFPSFRCNGSKTIRLPENACLSPFVKNIATCLEYVEPGSQKYKKPPPINGDCCRGTRNFVKNESGCACSIFGDNPLRGEDYAVAVDAIQARNLSTLCKADLTEVSKCFGNIIPTAAPPPANAAVQPSAAAFLGGVSLAIASVFFG